MVGFQEVRFLHSIAYGATGGPAFATTFRLHHWHQIPIIELGI